MSNNTESTNANGRWKIEGSWPKLKPLCGKKQTRGIQCTMDTFRTVNTVNPAQAQGQVELQVDDDVDYEAAVQSEGTEWVDVSDGEPTSQDSHGALTQSGLNVSMEKTPNNDSWADVASVSLPTGLIAAGSGSRIDLGKSDKTAMQHKTDIPPIFLGYNRVHVAGKLIPLLQIAEAVLKAMGTDNVLNVVQPMCTGWYIYMKTEVDHETLVKKGITVTGKHIMLCSDMHTGQRQMVKITIKDLPLHSVSNQDVLDAVKAFCPPQSDVKYSNIWFNGKVTSIYNRDHFLYVAQSDLSKLPETLEVGSAKARVFKPMALTKCRRCNKEGH